MPAKSTRRDPRLVQPETIQLPDGRVVQVSDIMIRPTNRRSYNLRTKTEYTTTGKRRLARQIDT
jgi:hypothetical protein